MDSNQDPSILITPSPISRYGNLFASVSTSGSTDSEFFLKIYKFESQYPQDPIKLVSSVKVSVYFTSLAWSRYGEETDEHSYGFFLGGHHDGSVSLWSVSAIIQNTSESLKPNFGLISIKKIHSSPVNSIKINQKPSLIATASNEIVVLSIDKLTLEPSLKCPAKDDGIITALCWNDKISYILAAASSTGMIYIWEMKKVDLFLTITDQGLYSEDGYRERKDNNFIKTDVAWCSDGVQLIIAYDHPDFKFLTQYHMKVTHAPSAEYHGCHTESIISITKNPVDSNFLLSLGKDNIVTCWSIRSQKPVTQFNFNNTDKNISTIEWLSKFPDVFISATYDGEINHHRINFSVEATSPIYKELMTSPPKWLQKKSGVCFGFGGKFATFSEKYAPNIALHSIVGNPELAQRMKGSIEKLEKTDLSDFLDEKINYYLKSKEKNIYLFWIALKSCFTNNYNELFRAMGYDKNDLQKQVYKHLGKPIDNLNSKKERQVLTQDLISNIEENKEADDFWKEFERKKDPKKKEEETVDNMTALNERPHYVDEKVSKNINWNVGTEKHIKQSLLIGDLESAADVALKMGRDTEALLIASSDPELFKKIKQAYLKKSQDPFIKIILNSIINVNFESLVDYNVQKDWKEYILYAKTYLDPSSFVSFSNSLGDKISTNVDIYVALVCYILGQNYEKCVEILYNNYLKETNKLDKSQKKVILHNLFEQIVSINYVLQYNKKNDISDKVTTSYCELLINEGLFVEAATYLMKVRNNNTHVLTLYDRLYNHFDSKFASKLTKAQPPFNIIAVKPKIEKKLEHKSKTQTNDLSKKAPSVGKELFDNPSTTSKNPIASKTPFVPIKAIVNKTPVIPEIKEPTHETQFKNIESPINPNLLKKGPVPIKTTPPTPMPLKKNIVEEKVTETPPIFKTTPTPVVRPAPITQVGKTIPTPINPSATKAPSVSSSQSDNSTPMSGEEEFVHNSFEKFITLYDHTYPDENKQKDFKSRVNPLLTKLKNHELKITLLKLLIEFINLFEGGASTADLKKIYLKIQSNGWDQNKNWMSCMEKLINFPRK